MTKQDKAPKKNRKKPTKNDLPVLNSDQDFFSAFMDTPTLNCQDEKKKPAGQEIQRFNKHGLPVIGEVEGQLFPGEQGGFSEQAQKESKESEDLEEDFAVLLEASLKQKKSFSKKKRISMPIKKRLKRYPPPEAELDLHGFTALGAELKAKSFISTCKHQGYFSLRLIVG
ncbi:MAG: hypothetical protein GY860_20065, partial [Desulfobacteraceae bacterium]|nr:hypothetical protein [Desulfobacteraceae bacterium]